MIWLLFGQNHSDIYLDVLSVSNHMLRLTFLCNLKYNPQALQTGFPASFLRQSEVWPVPQLVQVVNWLAETRTRFRAVGNIWWRG